MSSIFYYEPFYDVDRLIDDAWSNRMPPTMDVLPVNRMSQDNTGTLKPLKPRMDLVENTEKNMVTATFELPGLKKDDVSIDVHNNRMTISGESKASSEHREGDYAVRERRYGKFSRTLQLPQGVKENDIKAKLTDGVLQVSFPKASPEQAPKKITVD